MSAVTLPRLNPLYGRLHLSLLEQPPEKVWITVQFVVGIFMTFVAFQGFLAAYKESRRQAHFYMSAVVVLILMIGVTQFQLGEFDSERYMGEHCSSTIE